MLNPIKLKTDSFVCMYKYKRYLCVKFSNFLGNFGLIWGIMIQLFIQEDLILSYNICNIWFSVCLLQSVKAVVSQSRSFTSQLNTQQLAIQELARNYANKHLKPNASKLDLQGLFPFEEVGCNIYIYALEYFNRNWLNYF